MKHEQIMLETGIAMGVSEMAMRARLKRKRDRRKIKGKRQNNMVVPKIVDGGNGGQELQEVEDEVEYPRLDELDDEQLRLFTENSQLVQLVTFARLSPRKAIERLGAARSERSVRDLIKRHKEGGSLALIDRRWLRQTPAKIFTTELKHVTLAFFFAFPAAGPHGIYKLVKQECNSRKIEQVPGETLVKQFLYDLPEPYCKFRQGKLGIREWEKQASPVIRFENATRGNELWQGDHFPLNTWVKVKENGEWIARKSHMTALLDVCSRGIAGKVTSAHYPDSWTISLTFRRAIMPKELKGWLICGIPQAFESDRGADFMSAAIAATLAGLKVFHIPDPPRYPNNKGKVERWGLTVDTSLCRILPGHMDAIGHTQEAAQKRVHELLTVPQLDSEIDRWIVEEYHQTVHSETHRKPVELWEETALLRLPESEDSLNLLLCKYDREATIQNTGFNVTINGEECLFNAPEFIEYWKRRVRIRYNPEDLRSVLVYCAVTGEYLCEAWNMNVETPRYTLEGMNEIHRQYEKGLLVRMKDYMGKVFEQDRPVKRANMLAKSTGSNTVSEDVNEFPAEIVNDLGDSNAKAVQDFMTLFKQQDRAAVSNPMGI
jgi:transposase InsO family protein